VIVTVVRLARPGGLRFEELGDWLPLKSKLGNDGTQMKEKDDDLAHLAMVPNPKNTLFCRQPNSVIRHGEASHRVGLIRARSELQAP
jgi:hypothetical protein